MSALTDRLERDLGEIAAGADPSPSGWESIVARLDDDGDSEVVLVLASAPGKSKRPVWIMAAAAALVVLIAAVAVFVATTDRTPAVDLRNLTKTFVSPRNGFSIKHPDRVAITPADDWNPEILQSDVGVDVIDTGVGAVFKGMSVAISWDDVAVSIDQWVDEHVLHGGCGAPRSQQEEITIDGKSGRLAECAGEITATVVAGGRVYRFTLLDERSDARAVFDAFAATVVLTPLTAYDFPKLSKTFDSPRNGYSVDYPGRAGVAAATDPWDPGLRQGDVGVDGIETGFGAYFKGASIKIPDGGSFDQWVDLYVLHGGCGAPRGQQAETIIDGQSGRLAECAGEVTATVVAGGRLYVFTLLHGGRADARAVFDDFAATIHLTPETAATP